MTKKEFEELLDELNIPVSEGAPKDEQIDEEVRLNYWEYNWDDNMASGEDYNTVVTYQVSLIAEKPRHPKLLELREKLHEKGLHPSIQHEHLIEERHIHSFFSIDLLENIGEENV